jgi:hypothetical protein
MSLNWLTEAKDIAAVRQVLAATPEAVAERKKTNVTGPSPGFSPEEFWHAMMGCLLSTQQRWDVVSGFLERKPFPLALGKCDEKTVESLVRHELESHRGIRFAPTIASEAAQNLAWLNGGGWGEVQSHFHALLAQRSRLPQWADIDLERQAAHFVDKKLKGFGPKQSRHLWLWLGLARYEMLLDSRMTKWLHEKGIIPFKVPSQALADSEFYEFILDKVQTLCRAADDVLPCLLDAAVFSIMNQTGLKTVQPESLPH